MKMFNCPSIIISLLHAASYLTPCVLQCIIYNFMGNEINIIRLMSCISHLLVNSAINKESVYYINKDGNDIRWEYMLNLVTVS